MRAILCGVMTLALAFSSGLAVAQTAAAGAKEAKAGVPDISLADFKP